VDVAEPKRDLARGDGRDVEHLFDQLGEVLRGRDYGGDVVALLGRELLVLIVEQLARGGQDLVERRAQLDRDQRQELVARAVGGHGALERFAIFRDARGQARAQAAERGGQL